MASSVSAQDAPPIGEAIVVIGDVKAVNSQKVERALKRGNPFAALEKIVVGDASKTQLKFSDGGIINLIASSEYMVDSYVFKDPNQKSQSLSSLAKGGFRAVSGSIAKENITGTLVRTPIATIGLRGTLYEVLLASGKLFVSCEEGKLVVSNTKGKMEIGPSSPTRYAVVTKGEAPTPATERPAELAAVNFEIPGGLPILAQDVKSVGVQQPVAPAPQVTSPTQSQAAVIQKIEPLDVRSTPATSTETFQEGVFNNVGPAGGLQTGTAVPFDGLFSAPTTDGTIVTDYSTIDMNAIPYDDFDPGIAYEGSTSATYLAPSLAIGALSLVGIIVVIYQCSPQHHSKNHNTSRSYGPCYCH